MKLPQFLNGVPPIAYVAAVPIIAFLGAVGVTLAVSGGDDDTTAVRPTSTVGPSLANLDVTPSATAAPATSTPQLAPTIAPPANREDCGEIEGTDYLSPEERQWYLSNCTGGGGQQPAGGGGGGGGGAPSGEPVVAASEYGLGDRVVIPSIGLDASVNGIEVPSNGAMPDPAGYFNFLWYDFKTYYPSLGGDPGNGNAVISCHVDSAVHGVALCWDVRYLTAGATIQYIRSNGEVFNYVVTSANVYSAATDFTGIVSSGAADLTIITCTGTFASGSYDSRSVVTASLQ